MSSDGQFGIPSLVVALVITGLVWKYLWPSGSSAGSGGHGRDSLSQMRQREVAVERIQQMFPQVDRRTILWDLQRNGGSIAATTEKILSGTIQPVSVVTTHPDPSNGREMTDVTNLYVPLNSRPSPFNPRHRRALIRPRRPPRSPPPLNPSRNQRNRI